MKMDTQPSGPAPYLKGHTVTFVPLCCAATGLVCFDLDHYLEMTQKSGKWQCPGTRKFHTWRTLQVGLPRTA
jgi:hypothetical protein